VIRNNKGLFLPDLRQDVDLPGVRHVIIGKDRTSLSWMGVPVHGGIVSGVMAIGSYRPNAFHQSDMELLSNMAGHAALALDNAFRHAEVEEQSYMDSLTGAYNHRHFLRLLAELGDAARDSGEPLSLIMLDVDHFKQYNDRYGHLAGDAVLRALCHTIKSHLKRTDVLGRWGGEEFAIALPNARGHQARQIADRIRGTMATLEISGYQDKTFPAPTVSQGIAEYPSEVQDVIGLVDRADHRLYVAKERGRDQVEPGPTQRTVPQTVQTAGTGMSGRTARFRF
jgi:diguanylate cyclase (GGDEF)-like protein